MSAALPRILAGTVTAVLAVAALVAPAAAAKPGPAAQPIDDADVAARQIIVRFAPGASHAERSRTRDDAGVDFERAMLLPRLQLVTAEPGQSRAEAIADLERNPNVEYADADSVVRAMSRTPDDPRFGQLWGLHNVGQGVLGAAATPDADIDAPEAWDITTGSSDVIVAVADTGVAYDHPDLAANMWTNPDETAGNGVDDDGDGFVDNVYGADFHSRDGDPRDYESHGTHVAGTIAGVGNNGTGVAGVSWRARIMALRGLGTTGRGRTSDLVDAFTFAGRNGAAVVNGSFGGGVYTQAFPDAMAAAPNTLFVLSAGNLARDNDTSPSYPCSYPNANLVCVAATTQTDDMASFSNWGATSVDLGAPGTQILSTFPSAQVPVHGDGFETDDFATKWVTGGTNDTWARTTTAALAGTASATDSPGGDYLPNTNSFMRTAGRIDLTGREGCVLRTRASLATEPARDHLILETSEDGSAWTERDRHSGFGLRTAITDISMHDGRQAYVRYRLTTDGSVQHDGVIVDDVSVLCRGTTYDGSEYQYLQGTSMAAPQVAGAAALVRAHLPTAGISQVKQALLDSGDAVPALSAKTVSGRRLNVNNALRPSSAPTVTTAAASGITRTGATLNGSINPNGTSTDYQFEYGVTTAYGSTAPATPANAGGGTTVQSVSQAISGLAPGTTYHARLVAIRGAQRTEGGDITFTTAGNTLPTAVFSFTPQLPRVGQAVTFDGSGSTDAEGAVALYRWDLDGDGSFETVTGTTPTASMSYTTAGTRSVRLEVTDSDGGRDTEEKLLTVAAPVGGAGAPTGGGALTGRGGSVFGPLLDATPPLVAMRVATQRLRSVVRRGLRTSVRCNEACSIVVRLSIDSRAARRLGIARSTAIATAGARLAAAATKQLTLRPNRTARRRLARLRTVRVTLRVVATDMSGNKTTRDKVLRLRR